MRPARPIIPFPVRHSASPPGIDAASIWMLVMAVEIWRKNWPTSFFPNEFHVFNQLPTSSCAWSPRLRHDFLVFTSIKHACHFCQPPAGGRLPCLPDSGRHAWHVSSKLLEVFVPSLKIREQLQCEVELFLCILSTMCNRVFYVWHWRILPGKAGYLQADLMPVQEDKSIHELQGFLVYLPYSPRFELYFSKFERKLV